MVEQDLGATRRARRAKALPRLARLAGLAFAGLALASACLLATLSTLPTRQPWQVMLLQPAHTQSPRPTTHPSPPPRRTLANPPLELDVLPDPPSTTPRPPRRAQPGAPAASTPLV